MEYILSSGQNLLDARNEWFVNKYGWIMYGDKTDGDLINRFGIRISPDSVVRIAHFNQYGNETDPSIYCNASGTV